MSILGEEALTLIRFGTPSRNSDGEIETDADDAPEPATFYGSLQPLNDRELQLLPEGERFSEQKKLYTATELLTTDQHNKTEADCVQHGAVIYKVMQVERQRSILPHYKVRLMRLQEEVVAE